MGILASIIKKRRSGKTSFTTGSGLLQITTLPFGLYNAPATFERLMEHTLQGLIVSICFVFLDVVIIIDRDFEEHQEHLKKVLERLRNAHQPRKRFPF